MGRSSVAMGRLVFMARGIGNIIHLVRALDEGKESAFDGEQSTGTEHSVASMWHGQGYSGTDRDKANGQHSMPCHEISSNKRV